MRDNVVLSIGGLTVGPFVCRVYISFGNVLPNCRYCFGRNPPQNCKSGLGAVGEVDGFALIRGRRQLLAPTYQLGALVGSGTYFGAGKSFSTPSRVLLLLF